MSSPWAALDMRPLELCTLQELTLDMRPPAHRDLSDLSVEALSKAHEHRACALLPLASVLMILCARPEMRLLSGVQPQDANGGCAYGKGKSGADEQ